MKKEGVNVQYPILNVIVPAHCSIKVIKLSEPFCLYPIVCLLDQVPLAQSHLIGNVSKAHGT